MLVFAIFLKDVRNRAAEDPDPGIVFETLRQSVTFRAKAFKIKLIYIWNRYWNIFVVLIIELW
jgi:hypothetical protein